MVMVAWFFELKRSISGKQKDSIFFGRLPLIVDGKQASSFGAHFPSVERHSGTTTTNASNNRRAIRDGGVH
jgi:hypothetical protein